MPGEYIFEFAGAPRVIFSSPSGESTWHVALKLLAYLIYGRRAPLVERSVGQRCKPDLVVVRNDAVRLWIDCGETSLRKLERVVTANPQARIVVVKDTERHLDSYMRMAEAELRAPHRVTYLAFGDGLVQGIEHALHQRNRIAFRAGPQGLEVTINGAAFAGRLISRRSVGQIVSH